MNIKIIINAFIIIFILHIIILNINYSVTVGNKKVNELENFESPDTKKSMDFLTNNNSNDNDEFKKKLLKYIKQYEPPKES